MVNNLVCLGDLLGIWVVGTQRFLVFSPRKLMGKMFTHFDNHVFQMG